MLFEILRYAEVDMSLEQLTSCDIFLLFSYYY